MKNSPLVYVGATLAGLVALAAIGALIWIITGTTDPYKNVDTKTFCFADEILPVTVVIVDATDSLEPAQSDRLIRELESIRESLPRFSRLNIFVVDGGNPRGTGPAIASVCNPGKPEDADRYFESANIVQQKYSTLFDEPFRVALGQIQQQNTADHSPIIEALETATVSSFGNMPKNGGTKRVVLISDMIHNTSQASFYKSIPKFPDFESTDAYRLHRPDLDGVEVTVLEVNRPASKSKVSRVALATFWKKYFQQQGAILASTWWDASRI